MLTEQRKRFIEEYIKLNCKNATLAAKNAGYSPNTAHSQASNIMKDNETRQYLEERKEQIRHELQESFVFEAKEAFNVMSRIMRDAAAKDSDRINAAKDFLDRAGFKPKEKVEVSKPIDDTIKELEAFFDE